MIAVHLDDGGVYEFPDDTPEDVMRSAIYRDLGVRHQTPALSKAATRPDFSDVEGGTGSTARQVPSSFDLSHLQREADRVAAHPGTLDLSGVSSRHPVTPPAGDFGPPAPPLHRSEDYWRSVTGSDNPEDWSRYARNAQLGEIERGGAGSMSQAGFQDRGMYYENPDTGERYLKHHKSGAMPSAPGPFDDLNAQVDASREFLSGIPARIAGSVSGAISLPMRAAEGAGAGLRAEIEDLANAGHGDAGASSGAGFRRGFLGDWAANPVGQGADLVQRNVVDPARERLLDASIRAGDSPLMAAGTETGQAALGEAGNPVNWIGPAELIEGLRGAKALSPAAQRAAELEAQGGARAIEDSSGLVTREFGRGSAPSEIAQQRLARDLAVPREPLIYRDPSAAPGETTWKGQIPDTLRQLTGQPWRRYSPEGIPLEEPASAGPMPRTVERPPLPLPDVERGPLASDTDVAQLADDWGYASRRYPLLAGRVKRLVVGSNEGSYFEPDTGTLALESPGLGNMMHEFGHVAQHARGQIGESIDIGDIQNLERYTTRLGDVYSRVQNGPPSLSEQAEGVLGKIRDVGSQFGEAPEPPRTFDLGPDLGPEPVVPQSELARIGALDQTSGPGASFPATVPGPETPPARLYAGGPPPAPTPPPLTEQQVAGAMGWDVPPGSPRAISDPIRTANFQTNLAAQLGGGPESDAVAQYIVDRSDEVFRAIGPPQSWDTLEEMASRLGRTKESFLADASHWSVLSPEARLRLTYVIKGNEQRIGELQAKLAQGAATDVDKAELLHAIDTRGSLIQLGAKSGSAYGRALNSLKAEARLALGDAHMARQQLYRRYSKVLDTEKPMMDALARLDPGNPDELQAFLRHVDKPSLRQYIQEFWVASILSSPASHERNLIGNSVNAIMENAVVRPTAAAWDAARVSGPGAAANAQREVFFRETPAAIVGLGRGLRQGLARGLEVLRRGYDPESMSGKLFPVRSAFARSQNRIVRDYVGPVVTMPLRMLSASDAVAKTMNWTAEVYAQAARTAAKEGLSGSGFASRVAELVLSPTDDMISAADAFALKATFNDETSAVGKAIANLRDIPKAKSNNPVGNFGLESYRAGMNFMLPFIHIADRLMVRGVEYSPISFLRAAGERSVGNYAQAADLTARASVGSLIMAYVASLAVEGRITGAAPENEAERAAFYGANKQPWSVRTEGGRWIPYGQLQPIGTPFAVVAAAHKGWAEHQEAPDTEKLGHAAAQVGSYMTDQSFLSALSKMMDVISGSEQNAGRAFSDVTANTIWGFAPYSGLTRTVARGVDPRVIDTKSVPDKLVQNMPGASLGLTGKLDPWGEEIVPTGGRLRTVLASGTVMLPSQERTNPLDQELGRLGMPLGYVGNSLTDHKKKIALSQDEHYLYQQMAGRASKLLLQDLFAKEGYTDLDPEEQRSEATKAIGAARKFARIVVLRYHNGTADYPGMNPSLGLIGWVNDSDRGGK